MPISFDVDNAMEAWRLRVTAAENNMKSAEPLFRALEARWLEYVNEVFEKQGAVMGQEAWQPNAEYWAVYKADRYGSDQVGVMTGRMYESLAGGEGYTHHFSHTEASWGQASNVTEAGDGHNYADYFNSGTDSGQVARPFEPNEMELQKWEEMIEDFYAVMLDATGSPMPKTYTIRSQGIGEGLRYVPVGKYGYRWMSPSGRFVSVRRH